MQAVSALDLALRPRKQADRVAATKAGNVEQAISAAESALAMLGGDANQQNAGWTANPELLALLQEANKFLAEEQAKYVSLSPWSA